MNNQKNRTNKIILLAIGIAFVCFVVWTTYDIMSRTTRPGAKKHLPTRILK